MDIASLNIKVTQSGVQEGAAGMARLKTEATTAAKTVDQLDVSSRKAGAGVGAFNKSIEGSVSVVRSLLGAYSALQAINMADQFVLLQGRVQQSTRSIEEAETAWAGLLATAKETGQLEASVAIFQRLSFVRDEIQATTQEMLQFTETVGKLGTVGGASPDALKFGLTQLGQSLSSNVVRAEEFNSIMENIPSVGRAIATELGLTTGQLRNLVIEGKVASEDVFAAILNQTEEARISFEALPLTAARAWQQLTIEVQAFLGQTSQASGAMNAIIAVVDLLRLSVYGLGTAFESVINAVALFSNLAIQSIENLINSVISGINYMSSSVKSITGIDAGNFSKVDFNGVDMKDIAKQYDEEMSKVFNKPSPKTIFDPKETPTASAAVQRDIDRAKYQKELKSLISDTNKEEDKSAKLIDRTVEGLKFKNEQMGRSVEDQEVYNQLRQAGVEIDSAAGQEIQNLVRLNQNLKREQDLLNDVVNAGEGAFKKLWMGATSGAESWRDAMRGIVGDIQEMFYDLVIKSQVQNLMKGLFSSGGGAGGGGFSFGNISGALSSAGNFLGGLFGFADGGSFQVGGVGGTDSQLVAFRASPDENVTITKPGQSVGGEGGSTVVNYNIDARGADAGVEQRLMRAISALDRTLESRAMNAVDTQFKRNPKYGRRG